MPADKRYCIAVIGGTGAEGSGLAYRLAHAGHAVIVGSRDAEKAATAAKDLNQRLGRDAVTAMHNSKAARSAEVVILTVPYSAQASTVQEIGDSLRGKVLVDATVPLVPPKVARVQLPQGGSAVAGLQRILNEDVRIVSAFQNVSAHHLKDLGHRIDCDVLVCGDDAPSCDLVVGLALDMGLRAFHAGPLANSAAAEALTSVLIALNRRYKVPAAGIRLTGLGDIDR